MLTKKSMQKSGADNLEVRLLEAEVAFLDLFIEQDGCDKKEELSPSRIHIRLPFWPSDAAAKVLKRRYRRRGWDVRWEDNGEERGSGRDVSWIILE